MKALLLKDYYTLGKSLRSLVLVMLLWSVIPMAFLNVFAVIYGSMIPYSTMAYDQQSRWNTFARMLPYRERDIVLSRYVLGWLCTAIGGAAVLVFQNVLSLFSPHFGCSPWTVLTALCAGLFLLNINIPLMLRYGTEKARWVSKLVIILAFAAAGALGALVTDWSDFSVHPENWGRYFLPLLVLAVIATAVSIPLSLKFYRKHC